MLKRAESIDVDEKVEDRNRIHQSDSSGKLSGVGTRMARIFRTAFRREYISQSKQQLQQEVVEELNESSENMTSDISRRRETMERRQALGSSDWSSDVDFGSRTNLVKETKNSTKINNQDHEPVISSKKKTRKLQRSERVQSGESESASMNVIVDIHHENSTSKFLEKNEEIAENISSDDHGETENKFMITPMDGEKSLDSSLENSVESVKKQRKRWSKETSVILPPKRNSLSSSTVSERSSNWMDADVTSQPVPAPRLKKIIDNDEIDNSGVDNEAFESSNDEIEQVLTIKTESGSNGGAQIEMKTVEDVGELSDHSEISNVAEISVIRRLSTENQKIQRKINSKINSGTESKKDSDSVLLKKRRKSKSIPMTENSSSSISDMPRSMLAIDRSEKFVKKKKSRRTSQSTSLSRDSGMSETSQFTQQSTKPKVKEKKGKEKKVGKKKEKRKIKFISVIIHGADLLDPDYIIRHPMVIVHIVDEATGNYLKDSDKIKSNTNYLQPLITGIFDIKLNKSLIPRWDEELIFEYDFDAILNADNSKVLILFEIVDLPSVVDASITYDQFGGQNCWYKIAWAFLKPLSSTGISHLDKIVRLQLYKPKRNWRRIKYPHDCEPYSWWKSGPRERYPSTLFVNVTSIDPPKLEPVFYGHLTLEETLNEQIEHSEPLPVTTEPINLSRWSRLAAQSCKIPNENFFKTETSENGCFYVIFSNNGKYLACANYDEYDYPIIIYKVDEERVHVKFSGHKSFIYALDWSNNDELLLSVSSDQTARLWGIKSKIIQEIKMLPHPSYVYCGKFNPTDYHFIFTGCYDHTVRLWSCRKNSLNYELTQELDGHNGFVNSICFLKNGDFLTADSLGVIIQWSVKKKRGKLSQDWQMSRKIKIREIKDIIINTIVLHPLGSRLLIHSRDNGLRMLDLATGVVLQRYQGMKNSRIQITARISPCGGLLLCGGEDATLNIWNLESSKHIAKYSIDYSNAAVTCVDYHPYDHVLVYSIFGVPAESIVLRYSKQTNGELVGLKLLTVDDHNAQHLNDIHKLELDMQPKPRISRRVLSDSNRLLSNGNTNKLELIRLNESREDLNYRLKLFGESEGQFKTRSANRLSSIIAKIDRILSNSGSTHRSLYDIEANRIVDTVENRTLNLSSIHDDEKIIRPYVPPLFSTFEDNSTSETKSDAIEMTDMSGKSLKPKRTKPGKSKSSRSHVTSKKCRSGDDISKTMSDSAVISVQSRRISRKSRKFEHDLAVPAVSSNAQSSADIERVESSPESGGTYILSKNDSDKIVESESSVRSDVTFVIESEKPIPKPRRKKMNRNETIVQIE